MVGYTCPNMNTTDNTGKKHITLQNPSEANFNGDESDFFFVIDTCASLATATNAQNCKTEEESQAVLENMYVETKIQSNFWNSKNFLRNGEEMNAQFVSNEIQLNSAVFQRQAYSLVKNAITFRNNRWINVPYMPKWDPGVKYTAYDVSSAFNTIYPVSTTKEPSPASAVNPQDTYFSMQFKQNTKTVSTSSTREAVSNTFQRFGSYLALCLRFIGYVLGAYQRFSLDNSMTKKLYNYVEEEQHEDGDHDPEPPAHGEQFKHDLRAECRDRRKPFRYSMWRFFCKKNFASPWCLCCRHSDNYEDKLQAKARSRLYSELDILQIIQKLRIARFVAEKELTDEQRYLVNYHSEYMLFRDENKAKPFNASRYTDHRKEEDVLRDERVKKTVSSCIDNLNHNDHSVKLTYKAIMGRNRQAEEDHGHIGGDDSGNNSANRSPRAGYVQNGVAPQNDDRRDNLLNNQ